MEIFLRGKNPKGKNHHYVVFNSVKTQRDFYGYHFQEPQERNTFSVHHLLKRYNPQIQNDLDMEKQFSKLMIYHFINGPLTLDVD